MKTSIGKVLSIKEVRKHYPEVSRSLISEVMCASCARWPSKMLTVDRASTAEASSRGTWTLSWQKTKRQHTLTVNDIQPLVPDTFYREKRSVNMNISTKNIGSHLLEHDFANSLTCCNVLKNCDKQYKLSKECEHQGFASCAQFLHDILIPLASHNGYLDS